MGTWMAMLWTLSPWVPLTPAAAADGIRWRNWKGRSDHVDGLVRQVRVVRGAAGADVDRRAEKSLGERGPALALLVAGHGVVLRPVPRRVGDLGDLPRVVQEGVLVADLGREAEAVDHVRVPGDTGVADLDLVLHVVAELVEVRATLGVLEGDEVGDERDGVGLVGADERVDVGVVGDRVLGDFRGFAVGGHQAFPPAALTRRRTRSASWISTSSSPTMRERTPERGSSM